MVNVMTAGNVVFCLVSHEVLTLSTLQGVIFDLSVLVFQTKYSALISQAQSSISAWLTLAGDHTAVGVTLFPRLTEELIGKWRGF